MWSQLIRHDKLQYLRKSRFRRKFHLRGNDKIKAITYAEEKLREDAKNIIRSRLKSPNFRTDYTNAKTPNQSSANASNNVVPAYMDGHQTPLFGHPVFVAQHATATCCRKCMMRLHKVPMYRDLSEAEIEYFAGLIVKWIKTEVATETKYEY